MVANITLEQELVPLIAKLEELANQLKEIDSTVKFVSDNYDELLSKIKTAMKLLVLDMRRTLQMLKRT